MKLLERRPESSAVDAEGGVSTTLWVAVGLLLPVLYGCALVVAVVLDAWRAGA